MSDGIDIDHLQVGQSVTAMEEQTQAIAKTMSELESNITTVVEAWTGPDKDVYYQRVLPTWHSEVANLSTILRNFYTTLNDVSDNYKRVVQSNAQGFMDIRM
ncbi:MULTISPECIES: WXG100 family type VII secretion target [unclassified Streptomyces]|uniref:WXG100 family type VII secretion target n=1 Tax=unclassified Streptomyces TaxID=2593676 RepID=UPI0036EA874D